MGNPARGKGHEKGGLTIRKGGIKPQGVPLEILEHLPPNQNLSVILHSSDISRGYPQPPFSGKS